MLHCFNFFQPDHIFDITNIISHQRKARLKPSLSYPSVKHTVDAANEVDDRLKQLTQSSVKDNWPEVHQEDGAV